MIPENDFDRTAEIEDEEKRLGKNREMQLDEMADFHARLGRCETIDVQLSRRITALEEAGRGHFNDDPMGGMMPLLWITAVLTLAPLVIDLVKQWRSSPSLS